MKQSLLNRVFAWWATRGTTLLDTDSESDARLTAANTKNEDGVDLTQIREFLRLTPYERLQIVQNWVESLRSVRVIRGPGEKR